MGLGMNAAHQATTAVGDRPCSFRSQAGRAHGGVRPRAACLEHAHQPSSANGQGILSMKLQREPGTVRKSPAFMADRLPAASRARMGPFCGTLRVDETPMGGKRGNPRNDTREELTACGPAADSALVGARGRDAHDASDEAEAATDTGMSQGFVSDRTDLRTSDCPGDASACNSPTLGPGPSGQPGCEHVRDQGRTSRAEAFPGTGERGCIGIGPETLPRHPQRYIREFKGRQDVRESNSADPIARTVSGMDGRGGWSEEPIRDEDWASLARDVAV